MKMIFVVLLAMLSGCASFQERHEQALLECRALVSDVEYNRCMDVERERVVEHNASKQRMASSWAQGFGTVSKNYHDQAVINQMNANRPITGFEQPQQHNYTAYPMQGGGYIINGQ